MRGGGMSCRLQAGLLGLRRICNSASWRACWAGSASDSSLSRLGAIAVSCSMHGSEALE